MEFSNSCITNNGLSRLHENNQNILDLKQGNENHVNSEDLENGRSHQQIIDEQLKMLMKSSTSTHYCQESERFLNHNHNVSFYFPNLFKYFINFNKYIVTLFD